MRNIDSFVTKTYPLRSWIEKTYSFLRKQQSKSTNSVYYIFDRPNSCEPIRIRISDHISKVHYLNIIINADMSNKKKITYIVMLPTNNKVPMIVSSLAELKSCISYYIFSEANKQTIPTTAATKSKIIKEVINDDDKDGVEVEVKQNNTVIQGFSLETIDLFKAFNICADDIKTFTKIQKTVLNTMSAPEEVITYMRSDIVHPYPSDKVIRQLQSVINTPKRALAQHHWSKFQFMVPHLFDFDKQTKKLVKQLYSLNQPLEYINNFIEERLTKTKFEFFCDSYKYINCTK